MGLCWKHYRHLDIQIHIFFNTPTSTYLKFAQEFLDGIFAHSFDLGTVQ